MKSIFYRVWDNENQKYFEPTYEAFNGKLEDLHLGLSGDLFMRTMSGTIHCDSIFPGRFVVEHNTMLLDKNQTPIFEGDVCKDEFVIAAVIRHPGYFSVGGAILGSDSLSQDDMTLEIIGNIHQKPE